MSAPPPPWLQPHPEGLILHLYIAPRASRDAVVGEHDGLLKLQITAPPVEGKANKALLRFLADALGVARGDLELLSGDTGKRKRVLARGLLPEDAAALLLGA
jgi:uncharacterized protein (TIGR00251 family)